MKTKTLGLLSEETGLSLDEIACELGISPKDAASDCPVDARKASQFLKAYKATRQPSQPVQRQLAASDTTETAIEAVKAVESDLSLQQRLEKGTLKLEVQNTYNKAYQKKKRQLALDEVAAIADSDASLEAALRLKERESSNQLKQQLKRLKELEQEAIALAKAETWTDEETSIYISGSPSKAAEEALAALESRERILQKLEEGYEPTSGELGDFFVKLAYQSQQPKD